MTSHCALDMAVNDRVVFLRNDRDLDVKNGSTGKVVGVQGAALQALKHWSGASSVAKGCRNKLWGALSNVFEDPMPIALGMLSESLIDPTGRSSFPTKLETQPEQFGPLFLREERKWAFKKNTDTVSRSYVANVIHSFGEMRDEYASIYRTVQRAEIATREAMSEPLPKRSEELRAFHASLRSQKGINRLDERSKEAALKAYDERPDLIRENDKWFRDMERHPTQKCKSGECSQETRRALAMFREPTIEGLKVAPMVTRECDTLQRERTQVLSEGAGLSM